MNTAGLIIFALSFLIGGFLIGNLFPIFADKIETGEKKGEEDEGPAGDGEMEESESGEKDEAERQEPQQEPHKESPLSARENLLPIVNLWRDANTRKLVAEIGAQTFSETDELTAKQHAALSMALVELQEWIGLETQIKKADDAQTVRRQELFSRIEDRSLKAEPEPEERPRPPGFKPVEMLKNAIQAEYKPPAGFNKLSITAQINEVLQEMLEGTPLEERGIQLMDIPGRGMVVFVGLDSYGEIDSVPDETIRTAIRAAVSKWEKLVSNEE